VFAAGLMRRGILREVHSKANRKADVNKRICRLCKKHSRQ
jgi:hypothetical protein